VRIGSENKKELIAMIVLMIIAIPSAIYLVKSLSGGPSATPAHAASATAPAAQKKSGGVLLARNLDPTLRLDRLAASQKVQYEGGRRNIFRMEEPPPPPPPKFVQPPVNPNPQPPPPPPPPPITLKFYGFSSRPGEPKKVFLADGDDIFVAKEGDVINRKYKVVQIMNSAVVIEDLLNNNKQQIPLSAPAG
jgi:hypothetical protein